MADLVTLSWCLGEIREALAQTDRLLERQLASEDDDLASLRSARASLHQAHGALQVVAIEGVPLLTQEAERLLDAVERGEVLLSGKLVSRLSRAFQALVEHLETLLADVPHQPLLLYPYYRGLLEARRADRIHPADLFFPDLSAARPPQPEGGFRQVAPTELAAARAAFERGLLQVMRGADVGAGTAAMGASIDAVGTSQVGAANRTFWWVAQAWFEALSAGALPVDVTLKRLLGRLNLQLRKTIEERAPVAGQLTREMLFGLAGVPAATPRVAAVRAGFALEHAVPEGYEQPRYGRLDARVVRAAREAIGKARSALDKVTRGNAAELAAFSQAIDTFCDNVQQMPTEGLRALGRAFAEVRARLGDREGLLGETLSLELATAILFAEQALEDGARPGSDHDRHGHEMARRLGAAFAGDGQADTEMPEWLRSLSRAAQDRMTMIAFVAETGNNLRSVEKTLDAFFRDQSQREGLPGCVRALHQVAGALRLLGHEGAAAGAESVAVRVAALADGEALAADPAGFERIASSVGAIGFFVEGLQRPDRQSGRFEYDEASGDFHAHLTQAPASRAAGAAGTGSGSGEGEREGASAQAVTTEASTSAPADASSAASQRAEAQADRDADGADGNQPSVESVLETHADEAASLFVALAERPGDAVLRSALRETLARVRDAAMLLDRADRRHGADEALALLGAQGDVDAPRLAKALAAAGIALPVAHVPSAPMPADEAAIDSELLEIFLGEADEVLTAIEEHAALSIATPSDAQYLTTIRRGFHTLKGSSRMVGLMQFGEAGWALEQAMNQWLADERPGAEPLYALIDDAVARMSQWVAELRADSASAAAIDPRTLAAHADAVREGRDPAVAQAQAAAQAQAQVEAQAQVVAVDDAADIVDAPGAVEFHEEAVAAPLVEAPQAGGQETSVEADAIRFFDAEMDLGDIEVVELGAIESHVDAVPAPAMPDDALAAEAAGDERPPFAPADAEHPAAEPRSEPHSEAATPKPEAVAPQPESAELPDVVRIGARELSRQLYSIFLSEADDLIARLIDDVRAWRAHPGRGASSDGTRAAHSLKGSSTIVQLDGVHRIAERLEAFMQAQRACGEVPEPAELQVVSDAVERMQAMLHQFAAGAEPGDEPLALEAIAALAAWWRAKLKAPPPPEEGHEYADSAEAEASFSGVWGGDSAGAPLAVPEHFGAGEDGHDDDAAAAVLPVDEIDADLLPVFVEEADDQLPQIGENLRAWQQRPADASLPQKLMRQLHTVKGGARMAGAMVLGQQMHEIETRVEALAALAEVPVAMIDELVAEHDAAVACFEALKSWPGPQEAQPAGADDAAAIPAQADAAVPVAGPAAPVASASNGSSLAGSADEPAQSPTSAVPAAGASLAVSAEPAAAQRAHPLVRVRADLLDRLVNEAGEASIARSRLDNGFTGLRQSLADLTENVARLRSQLREIEIQAETQIQARIAQRRDDDRDFDPLEFDRFTRFQELTRMLAESVNDVATVQHNAMRTLEDSSKDLHRQGQVLRDLQQNLMRVRMLQFGSIGDRLYRVVRQSAKELDKRVNLDIRGATVEIDRSVLDRMAGPIEHLLRNAVAHGIEPRERRVAAGKQETGEIAVEVRQEGREIVLSFADDGGGLDAERIRARALAAGLIEPDAPLGAGELGDLIFTPGFSTAESVTEISGRGVGMDVVRSEVASLGGRIETESMPGRGTRFTIHLPLTLAVSQVVLVSAGKARFAVPSSSVEQLLQLKPQALASAYAERSVEWQGTRVPLFFLGSLVEMPDLNPVAQHYSPVLVLRSGHQRIALHCDEVTRNQEVVVKNVGPQAARVRGVTGATVLGNGDIVLIVNPVALAQVAAGEVLDRVVKAPSITAVMAESLPPVVMVVDDSVTVRKVTQRLLAREGYQVLLAKDGVDALRQLEDTVPDVMLLDIEMPRMDGFDLARHLRGDERLREVPIVMISSRTADKHRNHAMSLGVNVFLGKPYGETQLLEQVAGFTANRRKAMAG